jgi:hypothetical protein
MPASSAGRGALAQDEILQLPEQQNSLERTCAILFSCSSRPSWAILQSLFMISPKYFITILCSLSMLACGSGGQTNSGTTGTGTGIDTGTGAGTGTGTGAAVGDNCPDLSGAYSVTTEIVSTTCRLGLHTITQPDTYTFTQTAPSCQFTMINSIYPSSVYTGHFVVTGASTKVIWDSESPALTSTGYALTYTAEDLTIAPGTLSGSFTWHSGAGCDGTTNVCNGSVPTGCATPL